MATYYKFRPTAGYSLAIADDVAGAKLPPVQYGRWLLEEKIELRPGDGRQFGPDADEIIKGVQADGYYVWTNKG